MTRFLPVACAALLLLAASPAPAEKADRAKPWVIEAERDGVFDLQRQVLVYTGNVVITQGTMVLRAERIELRELPDGSRTATALGAAGRPASWRQRRDGTDEVVEGTAERIEYDGRADTLRLSGGSTVRRLRGATVADEITGAQIVWDNGGEVFRVEGGSASPTNPGGRVRAVLSPRAAGAAASAATPGSASPSPAPAPALTPSRGLGERPGAPAPAPAR